MAFKIKNPIKTPLKQMGPKSGPSTLPSSLINKLLTNDNIQNFFEFGKAKFDAKEDHQMKKDLMQETLDKEMLAKLQKQHPSASIEELKNYALNPERGQIVAGQGVIGSGFPSKFEGDMMDPSTLGQRGGADTPHVMPRNILYTNNPNAARHGYNDFYMVSRQNDPSSSLFGMTGDEKTEYLKSLYPKTPQAALDPTMQEAFDKARTEDIEWFNNPITRERWKNQAQFSGSDYTFDRLYGKDEYDNFDSFNFSILDQPNKMSDYDLDNMLNVIATSNVKIPKPGQSMPYNPNALGMYADFEGATTNPLDYYNTMSDVLGLPRTKKEFYGNYATSNRENENIKFETNKDVWLNPNNPNFGEGDNPKYDLGNVLSEEFLHASHIDKAMDSKLRNTLVSSRDKSRYTAPEYVQKPGELYAKFHLYRKELGMKPGEQFDKAKLEEYIKNAKNPNDNIFQVIQNNFTQESIIEALNTIASKEDKIPGSTKWDELSSKQMLSNIEQDKQMNA